jgi:hypothetical protein
LVCSGIPAGAIAAANRVPAGLDVAGGDVILVPVCADTYATACRGCASPYALVPGDTVPGM